MKGPALGRPMGCARSDRSVQRSLGAYDREGVLRACTLFSGSSANASLVESATTLLLVDAGGSPRRIRETIAVQGRDPEDLDAIVLTHGHSDHIASAPKLAEDHDLRHRFLEEARLLRRIRSPHVVTVHDVGRLNDGRPYFVMDYADRGTLQSRLDVRRQQPLGDHRQLLALADAIADGVSALHEAGVIHRDVKPANILFQLAQRGARMRDEETAATAETTAPLVANDERILLGDLGIAKPVITRNAVAW